MFNPPSSRSNVKNVCAALCAVLLAAAPLAHAVPIQVYFNDFQTAVGSELASTSGSLGLDVTPTSRSFLGRLDGNATLGLNTETVTLTLTGLAAHSDASVSLDLFIIQSWDGNSGGVGPDIWRAGHSGSLTNLQNTTFAIYPGSGSQCYPSDCPATNAIRGGADEPSDSLGYSSFYGDSVYNLSYSFVHTGSTLTASFTGAGLQGIGDESWGIDNLRVAITPTVINPPPGGSVPEPASLALLGIGLAGFAAARRRKTS